MKYNRFYDNNNVIIINFKLIIKDLFYEKIVYMIMSCFYKKLKILNRPNKCKKCVLSL